MNKIIPVALSVFMIGSLMMIPNESNASDSFYSRTTSYLRRGCEVILDDTECVAEGCYYWDSACHNYPVIADDSPINCYDIEENIQFCFNADGSNFLILGMYGYGEIVEIQ